MFLQDCIAVALGNRIHWNFCCTFRPSWKRTARTATDSGSDSGVSVYETMWSILRQTMAMHFSCDHLTSTLTVYFDHNFYTQVGLLNHMTFYFWICIDVHNSFHTGCIHLHSHPKWTNIPFGVQLFQLSFCFCCCYCCC